MSQRQILIETPHSDFGDIVSQSLGKEAECDVQVATSNSEAITLIKKSTNLNYALLDMDMGVEKALEQGFTLRKAFPSIALILISKKYPPAEMEDIRPWKFLRKPFILRELLELISDGNDSPVQKPDFIDVSFRAAAEDTLPAWYTDEVRATKNLVAAISNLVVQEAILVSDTSILAHSGELPRDAVEECSTLVRKYWGENSTAELIKPIRLQTTRKEHLLSATVVAVGIILALTFDAETPFDILRSQTRYLTNVLKNPRLSLPEVHILPKNPETQVAKIPAPHKYITDDFDITKPASREPFPALQFNRPAETREETMLQPQRTVEDPYRNPDFGELRIKQPVYAPKEPAAEQDSPIAWREPARPRERNQYKQSSYLFDEDQPVEANSPINVTGEWRRSSFNPTETSLFDVYYACVVVPRIKTQALDSDCANYLREELPKIFMAYGWRLEELIIEQEYMQWVVRIPPTMAPATHIKAIMRESSQIILTNFARFNRNEFLREFWSPGYLLGGGRRLIPESEIGEFINMNRRQYYAEEDIHLTPKRDPLDYRQ